MGGASVRRVRFFAAVAFLCLLRRAASFRATPGSAAARRLLALRAEDSKYEYARHIIEQHERAKKKREMQERAAQLWLEGTMHKAEEDAAARAGSDSAASPPPAPAAEEAQPQPQPQPKPEPQPLGVDISTRNERMGEDGSSKEVAKPHTLEEFLAECHTLGPMRFVVIGNGAILEAAGEFSNMRHSTTPKGELLTFSASSATDANGLLSFELHLRPDNVRSIEMVEKLVDEEKKLLILRFRGQTEHQPAKETHSHVILSAILKVGGDDASHPDCVEQWYHMREQFGDSWVVVQ